MVAAGFVHEVVSGNMIELGTVREYDPDHEDYLQNQG